MQNFLNDLKTSQALENKLADILSSCDFQVETTKDKGSFTDYDVLACKEGRQITFEVKYDALSSISGNVAVELHSTVNGEFKKSGLATTKADYYAYAFPNDENFYLISPSVLKTLVASRLYKRKVQGGDGNRVTLALFDKNKFLTYCMKLTDYIIEK